MDLSTDLTLLIGQVKESLAKGEEVTAESEVTKKIATYIASKVDIPFLNEAQEVAFLSSIGSVLVEVAKTFAK